MVMMLKSNSRVLGIILGLVTLMSMVVEKSFDFDRYLLNLYNRSRVGNFVVRRVPLTREETLKSQAYVSQINMIDKAISAVEDSLVEGRYKGALVIIGRIRQLIEQDTTLLKYMFNYASTGLYCVYAYEAYINALRKVANYDLEKLYSKAFSWYEEYYIANREFHDSLAEMFPEELGLVFYNPETDRMHIEMIRNQQIDVFNALYEKWKKENNQLSFLAMEGLVEPIVHEADYYYNDFEAYLREEDWLKDVDEDLLSKTVEFVRYMCEPFISENIRSTLENFDRLDDKRKEFFLRLVGFSSLSFKQDALVILRKNIRRGMLFLGEFHNHSGMYLYQYADDPDVRRILLLFESRLEGEFIEENLHRVSENDFEASYKILHFVFEYLSPDKNAIRQLILLHRGKVVRMKKL